MTWWCAARDVAWTWHWQPYPGVWLFMLALVGGYIWMVRRMAPKAAPPGRPPVSRRQWVWFGIGALALWAATDWPIGALGSGYLLSVHTIQWILYTLVAPPLLLLGVPDWLPLATREGSVARRLLRVLALPVVALIITDAILLTSHVPAVVDGFRRTQAGSFLIDMAWLAGGLVMWWPILAPNPMISRVSPPWQIGYLFFATVVPTVPAAFLTFADFPVYALYELAPRVHGIPAGADQQVAGLLMKAVADPILWLAMGILFFQWSRREAATDREERDRQRVNSPVA
ncbi:MAG TPA: cytochrome c oxidase assembly protein [Gemmatimonadales bacterium]|nr:cytochrome c oxidase assembly protein [Gemmatimonadales bacterium]